MTDETRNPEAEAASLLVGKILDFLDREVGDLPPLAELQAIIAVLILRMEDDHAQLEFLLQEVGAAWATIKETGTVVEVHLVSSTELVPPERKN